MCNKSACDVFFLQALLYFIYWDKVPDMEELMGLSQQWASTLMSQHLLAAADQYGIERLRFLCETKLCEEVAINTVATTLALAEQHHCFQLKSVCLKFVAEPENLKGTRFFISKKKIKFRLCEIERKVINYFYFCSCDAKRWI